MLKKISMILLVLAIVLMAFPDPANATGAWSTGKNATWTNFDQGKRLNFQYQYSTGDSTSNDTSATFSLARFDGDSYSTYPVPYGYMFTSTLGSPKISVFIDYSYDNTNWAVADTLCSSITSEALAKGTKDYNNIKAPYFRLRIDGIALNRHDTLVKIWFYFYRPQD